MSPSDDTRRHQHEIEIDAAPEEVWDAITDAEELARWFPLEAAAEPGAGGSLTYSWGPGVEGTCRIETWEPPRHLGTRWFDSPEGGDEARRRIAVDWHLEGRGGKTVLRLVHSGFGRGEEWDDEFHSTDRGWEFELRSLRHYLSHHRGTARRAFWLRQPVELSAQEAWRRLDAPGGLLAPGSLAADLSPGDAFRTALAGDEIAGRVLLHRAPTDFSTTVDGLGKALFRIGYESFGGDAEVTLWLSTWGLEEPRVDALQERWKEALAGAFGG